MTTVATSAPMARSTKAAMIAVVQGGASLTGSLVTRRWSKGDSNSRSHPLVEMREASLYFDPHELS
jgi:hypothetical protein